MNTSSASAPTKPVYERYLNPYSRGRSDTAKLAICVEYDERLTNRLQALDWDDHHAQYDPEYRSQQGHEGAWTLDSDTKTLETIRERTPLRVPALDECPINPTPFRDGTARITIVSKPPQRVSRTCSRCGEDRILSARDFEGVYKRPLCLRSELLLADASVTHICMACDTLFSIPRDTRSSMSRAMGTPPEEASSP